MLLEFLQFHFPVSNVLNMLIYYRFRFDPLLLNFKALQFVLSSKTLIRYLLKYTVYVFKFDGPPCVDFQV
jgi:hypothetical protein